MKMRIVSFPISFIAVKPPTEGFTQLKPPVAGCLSLQHVLVQILAPLFWYLLTFLT